MTKDQRSVLLSGIIIGLSIALLAASGIIGAAIWAAMTEDSRYEDQEQID